jgi:hypothetical protein
VEDHAPRLEIVQDLKLTSELRSQRSGDSSDEP